MNIEIVYADRGEEGYEPCSKCGVKYKWWEMKSQEDDSLICKECMGKIAIPYLGPADLAFREQYSPEDTHLLKAFIAGWDAAVAHAYDLEKGS